jgi:uncharacterized membrane protein YeaQ/YmgE (transglycosylase-associated protein family)
MQTATTLIFGALVGWLLSLYVRAGGVSYHALYALVGMAGSSLGTWLVDASHLVWNRPEHVRLLHRLGAAFVGTAALFAGFWAT